MVATNPLQIALSSYIAQQKVMGGIFNNMSNASNPAYTRKEIPLQVNIVNGQAQGVLANETIRVADEFRIKSIQDKVSDVAYHKTVTSGYDELCTRLGKPNDKQSVGYKLTEIKNALSSVSDGAEISTKQTSVVSAIQDATLTIRELAEFAQINRRDAENKISSNVDRVNSLLVQLDELNQSIGQAYLTGHSIAEFQDQQDAKLKELGQCVDLMIVPKDNMSVEIYTTQGHALLLPTGASQLSFTPAPAVSPSDTPADLGKVTIGGVDITAGIVSGSLGGYIYQRDVLFVDLQEELDELSIQLRDALNAIHNRGTSLYPKNTLTGDRIVTGATALNMTGSIRIAVVETVVSKTDGTLVNFVGTPADITLNGIATVQDLITQINATLGLNGTASIDANGHFQIAATNGNHGIAIASTSVSEAKSSITNLGFSHHFGLNNLLTTGTRFIQDGVAGQKGLAQGLNVRSDIATTPRLLSHGTLYAGPDFATTHPQAIRPGANDITLSLQAAFDATYTFAASGDLPTRIEKFSDFANSIYEEEARAATISESTFKGLEATLKISEKAFQSQSGVNVQEMMSSMIETQFRLSLSARMIEAVKDMNEELLKI